MLYKFPIAAVTNYHKLGGLQQQIYYCARGQESQMGRPIHVPAGGSRGHVSGFRPHSSACGAVHLQSQQSRHSDLGFSYHIFYEPDSAASLLQRSLLLLRVLQVIQDNLPRLKILNLITPITKWAKKLVDVFTKKIHKWPTSTGKDAPHH